MWFKVDDKLWGSPKWLATPPGGRALWVTAGSWSMDQLTDGGIPQYALPVFGATPEDAETLVNSGLWVKTDTGWRFHDWFDYQPTRESVVEKRKKEAQRKADWRERKAAEREMSQRDKRGTDAGTDAGSPATVTPLSRSTRPDPTRPDPTTPKGVSREPASETAAEPAKSRKRPSRPLPDDWQPNDKHRQQAAEKGVDLEPTARRFRNWAESKDARYANWDAAFRNWIDRENTNVHPIRQKPTNRAPRMADFTSEEWKQLPIEERAAIAQRGQM